MQGSGHGHEGRKRRHTKDREILGWGEGRGLRQGRGSSECRETGRGPPPTQSRRPGWGWNRGPRTPASPTLPLSLLSSPESCQEPMLHLSPRLVWRRRRKAELGASGVLHPTHPTPDSPVDGSPQLSSSRTHAHLHEGHGPAGNLAQQPLLGDRSVVKVIEKDMLSLSIPLRFLSLDIYCTNAISRKELRTSHIIRKKDGKSIP